MAARMRTARPGRRRRGSRVFNRFRSKSTGRFVRRGRGRRERALARGHITIGRYYDRK